MAYSTAGYTTEQHAEPQHFDAQHDITHTVSSMLNIDVEGRQGCVKAPRPTNSRCCKRKDARMQGSGLTGVFMTK